LRRKLDISEQRRTDVEAKLVEGALISIGHAIGILRSYLRDLNVRLISQGYNCDGGKAEELFDESRAALEPFVEKLNLLVSDEEEEEKNIYLSLQHCEMYHNELSLLVLHNSS
jgi:hypothetical protein